MKNPYFWEKSTEEVKDTSTPSELETILGFSKLPTVIRNTGHFKHTLLSTHIVHNCTYVHSFLFPLSGCF